MGCRETKSKQQILCFNLSTARLFALISSENEFENFGLDAKTSQYTKRTKKNSSNNWERKNNRVSLVTALFWVVPPSRAGRGQHIWYRQNLGSAAAFGQIKKPQTFYTVKYTPLHIFSMEEEAYYIHKTIPDKRKGGKLIQEHVLGDLPRKGLGGHL